MKKIMSNIMVLALVIMASVQEAMATVAEVFTAVDTTGMAASVQTILIAFIGIGLLFLAWRYVKRTGVR